MPGSDTHKLTVGIVNTRPFLELNCYSLVLLDMNRTLMYGLNSKKGSCSFKMARSEVSSNICTKVGEVI